MFTHVCQAGTSTSFFPIRWARFPLLSVKKTGPWALDHSPESCLVRCLNPNLFLALPAIFFIETDFLCIFGWGHHMRNISLKLFQVWRRQWFGDFSVFSSGDHIFQWSRNVLVENIYYGEHLSLESIIWVDLPFHTFAFTCNQYFQEWAGLGFCVCL